MFFTILQIYGDPDVKHIEVLRMMLSFLTSVWPFIFLKLLWWGGLYWRFINHKPEQRDYALTYLEQLDSEVTCELRSKYYPFGALLWVVTRLKFYLPITIGSACLVWYRWEERLLEVDKILTWIHEAAQQGGLARIAEDVVSEVKMLTFGPIARHADILYYFFFIFVCLMVYTLVKVMSNGNTRTFRQAGNTLKKWTKKNARK